MTLSALSPLATDSDLDPLQPDWTEQAFLIAMIAGGVLFLVFLTLAMVLFVRNLRLARQQTGPLTVTVRHEYPDGR
ncbi:hypothetical protein [Nocardioides sp.]|uniref:hypothetical protein n=1 Tax=Nocardioides sp. TaxID=35761 RepID=UPI00351705FD